MLQNALAIINDIITTYEAIEAWEIDRFGMWAVEGSVMETLTDIRKSDMEGASRTWVYISGPEPFIEGAKEACKVARPALEFYAASWAP